MNVKETELLAVPIREISRLTGVNTVTLRAWERRYGLLKPMRTGKGHRLYSLDDIQRVKDIQAWLVRGLAISKVKAILASDNVQSIDPVIDSVWYEYSARIETALGQLNRRDLESLLTELIALYPAELIADHLLTPILERLLLQKDYSQHTRLAFLQSVVAEQFYFGQYRQRQTARGKRLLVVKLHPEENDILPLILNYSLLVHTFQSEYPGYLPPAEWVFAAEQLRAEGMIIYSDSAANISIVQQQLADQQKILGIPLLMIGKITRMLPARIEGTANPVLMSDRLQSGIAAISHSILNKLSTYV